MKHRIAGALLLLGLLVTGATAVVAYLTRTVLNEEAFSSRLVAAIERPAVSAFVAGQIADAVVAANRDLTGVKPVIATIAQALVNSAPFQALVRRAAKTAHEAIFSRGAENVMLSIPDVGDMLRGTLETVSPELARRVPANLRTVVETRLTGTVATRVVATLRVVARIRLLARVGLIIGLLLLISSIAIAPARRQALLNAGIGLLAVAMILALVVPLGRIAITAPISDPSLRAAAAELWTAFTGGLHNWAIGLGSVAVMVMAGTGAFVERAQLRDALHRGLAEVAGRQRSPVREAARLALLLVLGAFALAAPLATLATATVVAGVLLLMLAVYELVALLAPSGQVAGAEAPRLRLNPALGIALGFVTVTAAGLGATALALRFRPGVAVAVSGPVLECNGAAALCDRRLDEITFAGAHNAMGSSDNPHWMFPNQDGNLSTLLRRGVRAFMLDVWYGHPVEEWIKTDFRKEEDRRKYENAIGPEAFAAAMRIRDRLIGEGGAEGVYMCHGFCELGALPFDTALVQLKTFLVSHPGDVVMLVLEDYVGPSDIAAAFERRGLTAYVYPGPWRAPFPRLRELIERGQRLIVLGENVADTIPWYHPAFDVLQETPYTFHKPEDFSCKPNRGKPDNPLFLINHWIESTPAPLPRNAELVNTEAALLERARECERERGRRPNVIAVDFAATGDVVQAAAVLNGLAAPSVPNPSP